MKSMVILPRHIGAANLSGLVPQFLQIVSVCVCCWTSPERTWMDSVS